MTSLPTVRGAHGPGLYIADHTTFAISQAGFYYVIWISDYKLHLDIFIDKKTPGGVTDQWWKVHKEAINFG